MSERKWDWPDTPTGRRNLETLSALAQAIGMAAQGRFVLLLAKCNLPVQREALVGQLQAMLEPLGVDLVKVGLDRSVDDLLSHLKARLESARGRSEPVEGWPSAQPQPAIAVAEHRLPYSAQSPQALSVHGLDMSLRSDNPHPPLLTHLNLARERYRELGCPLVLWLPDYALTRMAREAPDFWAWRSGVFEFAPEPEVAESALRQVAYEPGMVTSSLDAAAKRERLTILEQLLADYRELGKSPREQDAQADILWKMGMLQQDLGEYEPAQRTYQEALEIKRELKEERGIAGLLHQLGMLTQAQGDYPNARGLYRKAAAMFEQLGMKREQAAVLHQLGNVAYLQENYPDARRLYEEAAQTFEQLGAQREQAAALHQLGMLAQARRDYAEARRLYRESLEMAQQSGDRAGMAPTLHQLGNVAYLQGDRVEARRLYRESLNIAQQLGDRVGAAVALAQLALLEEEAH